MNPEYRELLLKSGFKVFGDKVVGADNGSSGNVTKSIAAFYCYVTEPLEANLATVSAALATLSNDYATAQLRNNTLEAELAEQYRLNAALRSNINTSREAEQRLIQQMEESFARQN